MVDGVCEAEFALTFGTSRWVKPRRDRAGNESGAGGGVRGEDSTAGRPESGTLGNVGRAGGDGRLRIVEVPVRTIPPVWSKSTLEFAGRTLNDPFDLSARRPRLPSDWLTPAGNPSRPNS